MTMDGKTMGTTWSVTYFDENGRSFKTSIDSLLVKVNEGINHYDPHSEISHFNQSSTGADFSNDHFKRTTEKALAIASASGGLFDPTVMPLVNAWGFGPGKFLHPRQHEIDSIKRFIGYKKLMISDKKLMKEDPKVQLDFGGIGQGYAADVMADFLKAKGVKNFLVELGGEGYASGKNLSTGEPWKIGILDPSSTPDDQQLCGYVPVSDMSFTTAGNYFNYRVIDGKKYGHTIDPVTGYPAAHEVLSVSVFAADCATADAWDTAFMVAGLEKSKQILKEHPELSAMLIYTDGSKDYKFYFSDNLTSFIHIPVNK